MNDEHFYENALEIKGLTKKYDGFKLEGLDLLLPSGCIMGFVGENGAGKTTTIKSILDLVHSDSGEIHVLGQDVKKGLTHIKENLGVVLDESFFPEALNVQGVDKIMKRVYKTWDSSKYMGWIERFELPIKKTFKEYSRGMKMKQAIAVALSHDSRLLILDEATSGLDPLVRDQILDVFLEFIQDPSCSIFISSHIISDLEKICDYIACLHKGRLVFSEAKDDLIEKYVVFKGDEVTFDKLPSDKVIGVRKNKFGVEALVMRDAVTSDMTYDKASIEDIMLFHYRRK
ncbi:MAG: ABC transporter [Clostridiales bacterium 38-18]|nr:MAG: ABC transporter [Clostridiales bacterium 38-18]